MTWYQRRIELPPKARGFHLITRELTDAVPEMRSLKVGLFHAFILHTSASITINENADPDVRIDMETAMNRIAPDDLPFIHTLEGPDDMPAHVKSSLLGSSVSVPIADGQLAVGTWQGIYLCEHRNRAAGRRIIVTVQGE
ncbi:MAG: secondary thiamine-phosphate synthase enzyme YjbQ [Planctomycetales bacterium]|nr:secondary thiamine-phosphate synthase enzyme YjbQ [Planctomycetales bacterium]